MHVTIGSECLRSLSPCDNTDGRGVVHLHLLHQLHLRILWHLSDAHLQDPHASYRNTQSTQIFFFQPFGGREEDY